MVLPCCGMHFPGMVEVVIPLEGKVNVNHDFMVPSDHLHPMLQHFFPARRGVFQDDNAPIHRAWLVVQWFDEHDTGVVHMPWPTQSPDISPIKQTWDIMERHLRQGFPAPSKRCELIDFVVLHPSCRIPDAGGLSATVHISHTGSNWWPNT